MAGILFGEYSGLVLQAFINFSDGDHIGWSERQFETNASWAAYGCDGYAS